MRRLSSVGARVKARCKARYFEYRGTQKDQYNNKVDQWDDGEDVLYYGLTSYESEMPNTESFHRVTDNVVMLAPRSLVSRVVPRSRMELNGKTYLVVGEPTSTEYQPFSFKPGGRIRLERTSG